MDDLNVLTALLIAGASGGAAPQDAAVVDRADLVEAARFNRLGAHLHRLALTDGARWATADVREELRRQSDDARLRAHRLRACAAEIAAQFPDARAPIILKGGFAHLLSGGVAPPRWSRDLDVLPAIPEELAEIVGRLGYLPYPRTPYTHEFGYFVRDDVVLDVHVAVTFARSPSAGWPEPGPATSRGRLNALTLQRDLPHHARYAELLAYCAPVDTEFGPHLAPSWELAVAIACAHTHRNYIEVDFPLPYGTARLAELSDIRFALRHPRFSAARFASICRTLRGEDATAFTARLLNAYFGGSQDARTLRGDCEPASSSGYGRYLWWNGTPASIPVSTVRAEPPAELVVRTRNDLSSLTSALGATEVELPREGPRHRWSTARRREGDEVVGTYLADHQSRSPASFSVSVERSDRGLRFVIDTSEEAGEEAVLVCFGDTSVELVADSRGLMTTFDRTAGGGAPAGPSVRSTIGGAEDGERRWVVEVGEDLLPATTGRTSLPVLVGVRRRPAADFPDTTIAPLHLIL
jgi:hypothetical protein